MATKKRLSLIYEIQNFATTYLGKVTKFQGTGLLPFGVLGHLLIGAETTKMHLLPADAFRE